MVFEEFIINEEKVKAYNKGVLECKNEDGSDFDWDSFLVKSKDDLIIPYKKVLDEFRNLRLVKDSEDINTDDVLVVTGIDNDILSECTDYKLECFDKNSMIYWEDYGICDNAEQVKKYFENLRDKYNISKDIPYIILLNPILKDSCDDWRWHKNGIYIGVQNKNCEYLSDETDIDLVYRFNIYKVS